MSVATTNNRVEATGNGATTAFPVSFVFNDETDLKVYQAGTLKTLTTHYTVSGGDGSTGTVTFLVAPTNGQAIIILRDPPKTQATSFRNQGRFFAEVHERSFDKLTMLVQRLSDLLGRAAVLPDTVLSSVSPALPTPSARKALVWNSGGTGLENSTYDPDALPAAAAASAAAAAAAAAAAESSAAAAAASYDSFDDRYLGAKAADPTLDNDGNALLTGALYWNTGSSILRVYSGSAWGNVPQTASFTTDTFSGDGADTTFTLSVAPGTVNALQVYISGVRQTPTTDYTVSGTTLTFTTAPTIGTNNILAIAITAHDTGTPSDGTVTSAKLAALTTINSGPLAGFRNRVVDGGCRVRQGAAPTITAALQYGAVDMHLVGAPGGSALSGTVGALANSGFTYGYGVGAVAASWTAGQFNAKHRIESANTVDLASKTITISGKVYHDFGSSRNFQVILNKANAADNFSAVTNIASAATFAVPSGTVTSFLLTATLGASDAANGLEISVYDAATNTVSNKNAAVGDLQLEIGSAASAFEHRPFGLELAMVERYYEKSFEYATAPAQNAGTTGAFRHPAVVAAAAVNRLAAVPFRARKRATPTVTLYNPSAANAQVRDANAVADCTSSSAASVSETQFAVNCTGAAGTAVGNALIYHWTADARL